MTFEDLPEWALGPAEAEVAGLLALAFDAERVEGEPFGGRSFYHQRHHLRLLARVDGALVGHVAVLWRAVRLGERLVDVAGLAEVATHPDRRGEGIAAALVRRAIDVARASQARHLLLFGQAGLYAGLGFRASPATAITHLALDGARTGAVETEADTGLMVLPLGDEPWDFGAPLDLLGPTF